MVLVVSFLTFVVRFIAEISVRWFRSIHCFSTGYPLMQLFRFPLEPFYTIFHSQTRRFEQLDFLTLPLNFVIFNCGGLLNHLKWSNPFALLKPVPHEMHAVDVESEFNNFSHHNLIEGVVEAHSVLFVHIKPYIVVATILKDERILNCWSIVWLVRILVQVEKVIDDLRWLFALTDHEEKAGHVPYLVPQERIADKMKIVKLVAMLVVHPEQISLYWADGCTNNCLFVVQRTCDIQLAEVHKVMLALKLFNPK